MTFKANEIEQYPYLVYTDDAGNIYDPNGGGGGGEPTDESIAALGYSKSPVAMGSFLIPADGMVYACPTLESENALELSFSNQDIQVPTNWYILAYSPFTDADENEFSIDENTTIEAVDTYGESVDIQSGIVTEDDSTYLWVKIPAEVIVVLDNPA